MQLGYLQFHLGDRLSEHPTHHQTAETRDPILGLDDSLSLDQQWIWEARRHGSDLTIPYREWEDKWYGTQQLVWHERLITRLGQVAAVSVRLENRVLLGADSVHPETDCSLETYPGLHEDLVRMHGWMLLRHGMLATRLDFDGS